MLLLKTEANAKRKKRNFVSVECHERKRQTFAVAQYRYIDQKGLDEARESQ